MLVMVLWDLKPVLSSKQESTLNWTDHCRTSHSDPSRDNLRYTNPPNILEGERKLENLEDIHMDTERISETLMRERFFISSVVSYCLLPPLATYT